MSTVIPLLGFIGAIILVLLGGCRTLTPTYETSVPRNLSLLAESIPKEWTKELSLYTSYFSLRDYPLYARSIGSDNFRVVMFRIGEPLLVKNGNILLVHGYMAHSGHLLSLGSALYKNNWQVFLVDLPGHGLTSGDRFAINDFSYYGSAVATVRDSLIKEGKEDKPSLVLGHSTGSSAFIEALPKMRGVLPQGIILGAPLIELQRRGFRTTLNSLAGERTRRLPEIFRNPRFMSQGASRNPDFRDFALLGDPLYQWIYAPSWLTAYDRWIEELLSWREIRFEGPVLVLQGEEDTVIDWRKNQELLPFYFSNLTLLSFPGFTHTIFNLIPQELDIIIKTIEEFLVEID